MIQLVAFLGNYGKQYSGNRHNVAWQFAESLPFFDSLSWQKKFKGQYSSRQFDGRPVHFVMPETFMNLSGESIVAVLLPSMNWARLTIGSSR